MLSPSFVAQYVKSIPALAAQAARAGSPDALLDLVMPDQYSFASAAWFLSSQCSAEVRAGLQRGSLEGWTAFVRGCVGTTVTGERQAYWERAVTALG